MKYITIIFALLLFVTSCTRKKNCPNDSPNFVAITNTFYYHDNSLIFPGYIDDKDSVDLKYFKNNISSYDLKNCHSKFSCGFIEGNYTVFEYYHQDLGCENTIDDEYECQFCFQIPKNVNRFIIKDQELNSCCYFEESYFGCPGCCLQKMEFIKGNISGQKDNHDIWTINAEVFYSCVDSLNRHSKPVKIEFKGEFIKHDNIKCDNYIKHKANGT